MRPSCFPVAASLRRMILLSVRRIPSSPTEANVLPSGDQATKPTLDSRPSNRRTSLPVAGSHRRIVLSSLAEASVLPSGDQANDLTCWLGPASWQTSLPVAGSHRRIGFLSGNAPRYAANSLPEAN